MLRRLNGKKRGVITFEWIILSVLLAIGLISGVGALRNTLNLEMTDVANAAHGYNASYNVQGLTFTTGDVVSSNGTSSFTRGAVGAVETTFTE